MATTVASFVFPAKLAHCIVVAFGQADPGLVAAVERNDDAAVAEMLRYYAAPGENIHVLDLLEAGPEGREQVCEGAGQAIMAKALYLALMEAQEECRLRRRSRFF